ncbi:hypothetical protein [Streptomyces kronopolitis]
MISFEPSDVLKALGQQPALGEDGIDLGVDGTGRGYSKCHERGSFRTNFGRFGTKPTLVALFYHLPDAIPTRYLPLCRSSSSVVRRTRG